MYLQPRTGNQLSGGGWGGGKGGWGEKDLDGATEEGQNACGKDGCREKQNLLLLCSRLAGFSRDSFLLSRL